MDQKDKNLMTLLSLSLPKSKHLTWLMLRFALNQRQLFDKKNIKSIHTKLEFGYVILSSFHWEHQKGSIKKGATISTLVAPTGR